MKRILLLFWIAAFLNSASAQKVSLKNDWNLDTLAGYFWGTKQSASGNYFVVNKSYWGTYLLNKDMSVVFHFETDCGACGGGNGQLSKDEKFFSWVNRDFSDQADTLNVIRISDGKEYHPVIPQFSDHVFFGPDHSIIYYGTKTGIFYQIGLEETKPKKIIDLSSSTRDFDATLMLTPDESQLIIHTESGGMLVYDTHKWKKVMEIENSTGRISDLSISPSGKYYTYVNNKTYWIRDLKTHELIEKNTLPVNDMIHSLSLTQDDSRILLTDKSNAVFLYDRKSKSKTKIVEKTDHFKYYEVFVFGEGNHFLAGSYGCRLMEFAFVDDTETPVYPKADLYSEEEAARSASQQLQIELALRKLGYDVALDNMRSDEDRTVMEEFASKKGISSIRNKEFLEALGLPVTEKN
ncbi:MAG: hypothetical protein GC181_02030 [Bacteroidetes bacterium]|nr:hypothetical protein [Bacteroidota bacterium]